MSHPNINLPPENKRSGEKSLARKSSRPMLLTGLWENFSRFELGPLPILGGLVLIWLFFQTLNPNFLTARNLSNLILQISVLCIITIGLVLILLIGEIDLSVGSVLGVCAAVMALLLANHGWNAWAAMTIAILLGAVIGFVHGICTVYLTVPSFIVTLAGLLAWQGVQLRLLGRYGELRISDALVKSIASTYLTIRQSWILAGIIVLVFALVLFSRRYLTIKARLNLKPIRRDLLTLAGVTVATFVLTILLNTYFGIPFLLVILLFLLAIFTYILERTTFGGYIYAIGGNAEAARRAGIRVGRIRIIVFSITSALAAVGGVISSSREFATSVNMGGGTLLLEAIASAVIGGTSLFGGRGRIYGALLGALVIGSVENGLNLLGQPASTKNIATGLILLFAVSVDALNRNRGQDAA